jgi:hypothetical protein
VTLVAFRLNSRVAPGTTIDIMQDDDGVLWCAACGSYRSKRTRACRHVKAARDRRYAMDSERAERAVARRNGITVPPEILALPYVQSLLPDGEAELIVARAADQLTGLFYISAEGRVSMLAVLRDAVREARTLSGEDKRPAKVTEPAKVGNRRRKYDLEVWVQ